MLFQIDLKKLFLNNVRLPARLAAPPAYSTVVGFRDPTVGFGVGYVAGAEVSASEKDTKSINKIIANVRNISKTRNL